VGILGSESGLYYYRARYYDPLVGRFVNEDPISFSGGVDFYTYAHNKPVLLSDPTGNNPGTVALPWFWGALETGSYWVGHAVGGGIAAALQLSVFAPSVARDEDLLKKVPQQCSHNQKECDEQYEADVAVCRALKSRACYDQAAQRYAACLAGRAIPPFPFRVPN
jgi:RHS repeat-associated protein